MHTYQAVEVVERNWLVRRLLGLFGAHKLKNGKKFLITSASSSAVTSEEWYRISKDKRRILINYKRLEKLPSYQFKLRKERDLDLATLIRVIPKKIIKDGVEMETRFVERPENGYTIREIEFEVEKDCSISQGGFVVTFLSRPKELKIEREFTEEGLTRTEIIGGNCIEILPVFSYDEWKGVKRDIAATRYELRWFSDLDPGRNTFRISYK